MKNYELINLLMSYPAGAEVIFDRECDNTDIVVTDEESVGTVLYRATINISDARMNKEKIILK